MIRPLSPAKPAEAAPLRPLPALAVGDAVALFAPSSHAGRGGEEALRTAQALLERMGLEPVLPAQPQRRHLYLAGTDAERAAEFERLYCDPAIKALVATRGGYGAARMLPHLDAARIAAAPPKPVVGMSDVVALLAWLHAEAGIGALHGPCLAAPSFLASPEQAANATHLQTWLLRPPAREAHACTLLHEGCGGPAAGRLVGGNLAVLASLLGTPWALETHGCVLFLEEVNEAPYRVDRYLTQFRQAGRLDGVAGVVFGHLQDCDTDPPGLLHDVLCDLFADAPYPVLTGLASGHGALNRTLALGRRAELTWEQPRPGGPALLTVC